MEPLLIGAYDVGVQQNLKPFMIPEQAFPNLLNAFIWRSRIDKKPGYDKLGRLRRVVTALALGNTGGGGAFSGNILTTFVGVAPNASVQPGSVVVNVGGQIFVEASPPDGTLSNGTGGTGTINYTTGAITIQTAPVLAGTPVAATFAYYPDLPVMGIRTRDDPTSVNQEKYIFFDTVYAYRFTTDFEELPSTTPFVWTGPDTNQFWTTNYQLAPGDQSLFWATNNIEGIHYYAVTDYAGAVAGPPRTVNVTAPGNTFQLGDVVYFANNSGAAAANNGLFGVVTVAGAVFTVSNADPLSTPFTNAAAITGIAISNNMTATITGDGIRYYDGTTWRNFNPDIDGINVLMGGLIVIPYKSRLVVLSTLEGNNSAAATPFRQRARWSWNGPATNTSQGWRSDIVGFGGFVDAPTGEAIISAGFVKDNLIVYFERSTWKLVYTGNEILPFLFQRINAELGAESTFSATQFDNGLVAFGNVGIHASNGDECQRIDQVIPDEVFNVHNNTDGPKRTSAVRDFFQEVVYLAYADDRINSASSVGKKYFPNKMILFNYRNNTFSFFDDNATTFGYFQRVNDTPWSGLISPFTWSSWTFPWSSGIIKAGFPNVAFGNQQGFVELYVPQSTSNDNSLYIQNISGSTITSPQHNLFVGQYVTIRGAIGVTGVNNATFRIVTVPTPDTFTIDGTAVGTYIGGGEMIVRSNILIQTKQFTPFWNKGKNYSLKCIDMLFDRTAVGEMTVDVFVNFSTLDSMSDVASGTVLGLPVISTAPESSDPYYLFQSQQDQIWKKFYTYATGETFQVQLRLSDAQMKNSDINNSDIVVHAMLFYFEESGGFY